jgi:hypothetical protein
MKLLNIAQFHRSRLFTLFEPAGASRLTTMISGHRSEPPEVCSVGQGMNSRAGGSSAMRPSMRSSIPEAAQKQRPRARRGGVRLSQF